jgi:abortive infection bacteriophage resistance protein
MAKKVFKNLEEQIEILKRKGLTINDINKAKEILLRENYFFINGYRHVFMRTVKSKIFIPGTTFEELYAFFTFDRALRNIVFKYLLVIENNIKSIFSYQLSRKYGIKEKEYLKSSNFTKNLDKVRQVHDIINKMKRQIRTNSKQHAATIHYINNYGYIPLWVLVKVLSFGIISELYQILKHDDQLVISSLYNLDVDNLTIFLSILANYRNLCAHEDILYNNHTQRDILDNIYHHKMKIPLMNDEYIFGKNDLFAVVIIFKYLLTSEEFSDFINEIEYEINLLDGKVSIIPMDNVLDKLGFPSNWKEIKRL